MEKKNCLILDDEFLVYCKLNNIEDVEKLARKVFNRGFAIEKYGEKPFIAKQEEIKQLEHRKEEIKVDTNNLYEE